MTFDGALLKEQGVTFGVVIVKSHVLNDRMEAQRIIGRFSNLFGGVPVVLMSQDSWGTPTYFGRKDIARFMAKVPLSAVPWRQYTVS